MTELAALVGTLEKALTAHGFASRNDVTVLDAHFDLAAEDDARLVFISVRSDNSGWLDDFYNHQAALDAALSGLNLGQKWRDVYLLEITTDPIDIDRELETVEEIQSNTTTARKLVIDASRTDPANQEEVEGLLALILSVPDIRRPAREIDVLGLLREHLLREGFSERMLDRLLAAYTKEDHDCVALLLGDLANETKEH